MVVSIENLDVRNRCHTQSPSHRIAYRAVLSRPNPGPPDLAPKAAFSHRPRATECQDRSPGLTGTRIVNPELSRHHVGRRHYQPGRCVRTDPSARTVAQPDSVL